jgi:hypothetical protein
MGETKASGPPFGAAAADIFHDDMREREPSAMSTHSQRKSSRPQTGRRHILRTPVVITRSGRIGIDIAKPQFHTLVFGANLIGLVRVVMTRTTDQGLLDLIVGYALITLPIAVLLGRVALKKMKERSPRLYTSAMSMVAFGVYAMPGQLHQLVPTQRSNVVALGTMAALVIGSAFAELLHRAARFDDDDGGGKPESSVTTRLPPAQTARATRSMPKRNRRRRPSRNHKAAVVRAAGEQRRTRGGPTP